MAGKEIGAAKPRADGGLSNRRECSKSRLLYGKTTKLSFTSNSHDTTATAFIPAHKMIPFADPILIGMPFSGDLPSAHCLEGSINTHGSSIS